MPATPTTRVRPPALAWLVFGCAAFIYFVAVVQRTALGVAGVEALDRFGVEALGLASLSIVQISVYAALQIPAGSLLDRVGPKAMLAVGSLIMALGQLLLAHADSLWWALAARVLLGAGDAPIFISATRLASEWFPPRQAPVMVQITGILGQAGQLASAVPVAWLLHASGWTVAFSVLAGLGVAAAVTAVLRVRMPHHGELDYATAAPHPGTSRLSIREALRPPGVRLAFWTHWTGMYFANTIAMLWGVPFLIQGQGLTAAQASLLLSVLVIANMLTGPVVGTLTARHPLRRSWIILGFAAVTAAVWASVLIPSTPRPMLHLIVWAAVLGAAAPASLVGMDFARTFGRPGRLGTATGFANIGGFAATVLSVALVGGTLQVIAPGTSDYTLDNYRIALATMAIPWVMGVTGIVHARRRTRAAMAADGVHVPPLRDVIARGRRF